jgi:hypothetical protein
MGKVRACGPMPVVKVKGRDVTGNRATSDVVTRAIVPNYPPISQARTAYGVLPQFVNRVLIPSEIADIRRYNEDRERDITGAWKLHKDQLATRLKARK